MVIPLIYYGCFLLCCVHLYTCMFYFFGHGHYSCYHYEEYEWKESQSVTCWLIIGILYTFAGSASFCLGLFSTKSKKFTIVDRLIFRGILVLSVLCGLTVSIYSLRYYTKDRIACSSEFEIALMNSMGVSVAILLLVGLAEVYMILVLLDESKKNKSSREPLLPNHS